MSFLRDCETRPGVFLGLPKLIVTNENIDYFRIIKPNCGVYIDDKSKQKQLKVIEVDYVRQIITAFYDNKTKSIHAWISQNKNDNTQFEVYDMEITADTISESILRKEKDDDGFVNLLYLPIIILQTLDNKYEILTRNAKIITSKEVDNNLYIINDKMVNYYSTDSNIKGIYHKKIPQKIRCNSGKFYIGNKDEIVVDLLSKIDNNIFETYYDYYNNIITADVYDEGNISIIANLQLLTYSVHRKLEVGSPYSGLILSRCNSEDGVNVNVILNDDFYRIGTISGKNLSYDMCFGIRVILENPDDNEDVPNLTKFLNDIVPELFYPICKLITQYCVLVISDGLNIVEEFVSNYKE